MNVRSIFLAAAGAVMAAAAATPALADWDRGYHRGYERPRYERHEGRGYYGRPYYEQPYYHARPVYTPPYYYSAPAPVYVYPRW